MFFENESRSLGTMRADTNLPRLSFFRPRRYKVCTPGKSFIVNVLENVHYGNKWLPCKVYLYGIIALLLPDAPHPHSRTQTSNYCQEIKKPPQWITVRSTSRQSSDVFIFACSNRQKAQTNTMRVGTFIKLWPPVPHAARFERLRDEPMLGVHVANIRRFNEVVAPRRRRMPIPPDT